MLRARKILLSAIVVGLVAVVSGGGTYAAFFSQTQTPGNRFDAGTVYVSDNDGGGALFNMANAGPGASASGCITITYSGSLPAGVVLYGSNSGGLASYVTLTVTRGTDPTPSFNSCAGFTPDGANYIGAGPGVVYSGLLSSYPGSYAGGVVDPTAGSPRTWTNSEAHSYMVTVTVNNDPAAQGLSTTASFTWEARNL